MSDPVEANVPSRKSVSAADQVLDRYFPVLDHGFVALVDYMGGDDAIERAARLSYQQGTRKASDQRGLLRYLVRHRHSTPLEMTEVTLHLSMPIFVARQLVRHRTASLNEVSARYSVLPSIFYTPRREDLRAQSTTNKQGRDESADSAMSEHDYAQYLEDTEQMRASATDRYHRLLERGVAREIARIDLPLSVYTQWYWKMDLNNLLHLLGLRLDPHAQWEIREYARVIAGIVQRVAPVTFEAWMDYRFASISFSKQECEVLRTLLDRDRALDATTTLGSISGRESVELREKIARVLDGMEMPSLALDPAQGLPGEVFQERYLAAAEAEGRRR